MRARSMIVGNAIAGHPAISTGPRPARRGLHQLHPPRSTATPRDLDPPQEVGDRPSAHHHSPPRCAAIPTTTRPHPVPAHPDPAPPGPSPDPDPARPRPGLDLDLDERHPKQTRRLPTTSIPTAAQLTRTAGYGWSKFIGTLIRGTHPRPSACQTPKPRPRSRSPQAGERALDLNLEPHIGGITHRCCCRRRMSGTTSPASRTGPVMVLNPHGTRHPAPPAQDPPSCRTRTEPVLNPTGTPDRRR